MRVTRFTATPDGGSVFEDVEVGFPVPREDEFGHTMHQTHPLAPTGAVFVELPAGLDQGWHNAPNRQLVTVLTGELEVETTDGERRRFGAGDIFMADDVEGRGHLTRVFDEPARVLFVVVPDAFSLAALGR